MLDGFTLDCDPPANAAGSCNRRGDPSPPKNPANGQLSAGGAGSSKNVGDPDGSRSNLNLAVPTLPIDLVALFDRASGAKYELPDL